MTNNPSSWQDDYWILLIEAYQKKPVGVKPTYSRAMVDLALELHIKPQQLHAKMFELRNAATPSLQRLWKRYDGKPSRLTRDAKLVRGMRGFFNAEEFYRGVATEESFESDFKPIPRCGNLKPVMLIMILDLYFRLTPITMNGDTPEVKELAKLLRIGTDEITDVMNVFQILDPYLNRNEFMVTPLLNPCQKIWQRFGNGDIEELAATAAQLKEYFS